MNVIKFLSEGKTDEEEGDKRAMSEEIQRQTEEFLKRGGKIQTLPNHASGIEPEPFTRTRRAQIEWVKRHLTKNRD